VGDKYPSCQEFVEFNRSGIKPRATDTLVNGSSVKTTHRKPLAGKSPSKLNNIYLPSDIPSLKKKLQLLVGEYVAGNTTTRSQILAVLDNLKERGEIALMEYTLIKNLAREKVPDVADEESPDEDDGSSAENLNADSSVENPTLNVEDVSEYLIPVDGHQNGACDMEHMTKVTAKDIIRPKCKHTAQLVNEPKNQLVHDRKHDERVKEIENPSRALCTGNPTAHNESQQALESVEHNSPAECSTRIFNFFYTFVVFSVMHELIFWLIHQLCSVFTFRADYVFCCHLGHMLHVTGSILMAINWNKVLAYIFNI
jgi:hypothetical protein